MEQNNKNKDNHIQDKIIQTKKLSKKQRYRRNKKIRNQQQQQQKKEFPTTPLNSPINNNNKNNDIRQILKSKIKELSIMRSSKTQKENVLEKTLKSIGIDKNKFKEDLENVKRNGGLEVKL